MEQELHAQIESARAYESLMVPALFGQWASRVLDAARIRSGDRVLDVACGTGVLAREAAARVGPTGLVAGIDPGPGMLHVAKAVAPEVTWHEALAESLPVPAASYDAVVSQFGLMFFRDRVAALREALRVLVPGGRLAFAVWDSVENTPAYAEEIALLERVAGSRAAAAVRAPFALGEPSALETLFREAGVADPEVTTHAGTARFPSVKAMVEADLRGWLPVLGVLLSEEEIAVILEEAEIVLDRYVTRDGTIAFHTSAHIVTGRKP